MSDKSSHKNGSAHPYKISSQVRAMLQRGRRRFDLHLPVPERFQPRYFRSKQRSLIRGMLVAHRRMFGVSNKSVQVGERNAEGQAEK